MIYHIRGSFGLSMWEFSILNQGVSIFFVLSGFILTYVYPELPSTEAALRFLRARVARIWPGYVATTIIAILIYPASILGLDWVTRIGRSLVNLAMLQSWWPAGPFFYSINGPSWSISTEFAFYCAFPFIIYRFRKRWPLTLLVCFAIAIGTIAVVTWLQIPPYRPGSGFSLTADGLIYISPLGRIFEFACGMCAALAFDRLRKFDIHPAFATAAEVVALALLILSGSLATVNVGLQVPVLQQWLGQAGTSAIPAALVILVMALGRGLVSRVLAVLPLIILGELSYSIYLLHYPLLGFHNHNLARLSHVPPWLALTIYVAALLLISYLVWTLVERPAREWLMGRRLRPDKSLILSRAAVTAGVVATTLLAGLAIYTVSSPRLVSPAYASKWAERTPDNLRRARFGEIAELEAYFYAPHADGHALHIVWRTLGKFDSGLNVAVHLLAKPDGAILAQADYAARPLSANIGELFEDVVFLSAAHIQNACFAAIALYRVRSATVLSVDKGPRDSDGRRLLIPLPNCVRSTAD